MPTQTRQTDLLNNPPTSKTAADNPSSSARDPLTSNQEETLSPTTRDASSDSGPEHPSKVTGQYHSVKGTVVEMIGNTTGSEAWRESGRREHEQGERELEDAEQLFPIE
ncbi:uncharacterized protein KD926_011188 [Aspergillus affinis]|uniref:uncharacterized protein n=1 Tax=Aspergillus affinis TaxID=1070780 RepID=UPI0022FF08C5|nr:uncharacterized protein KD926_011188 [Aspergillus affinis]KAI9038249.1 hypothetical protein KD926_011188 [Aspergillus affinis]